MAPLGWKGWSSWGQDEVLLTDFNICVCVP